REPMVAMAGDAPVQAPLEKGKGLVVGQRCERPLAVHVELAAPPGPAQAGHDAQVEITKNLCIAEVRVVRIQALDAVAHDGDGAAHTHGERWDGEHQATTGQPGGEFSGWRVGDAAGTGHALAYSMRPSPWNWVRCCCTPSMSSGSGGAS